jgi:hypothetical protein
VALEKRLAALEQTARTTSVRSRRR